jgi:asparagine synthase (glutamine-hydrolysing)
MCGIAGFWDRRTGGTRNLDGPLTAMTDAIAHRGPDDSGIFVDGGAGVGLGSRRLAIVDLSPAGHQPMASDDDRYVLAYNGEIYNFNALREELEHRGQRFRGSSDTEVLVAGVKHLGLREMLQRCNGMFALALWDRVDQRLHLARDRFGEKPLYYGWTDGVFLFGSELKALAAHGSFHPEIDRNVLALYFRHNCVPAPYSIYKGIAQMSAGTIVTLDPGTRPGVMPRPEAYWTLRETVDDGRSARKNATVRLADPADQGLIREAADELDAVLGEAVRIRMHADVPLGAFLSGGIDSSVVVALMQARHTEKVRTFTIAFEDAGFNEAPDARRVAEHLGTEHVELVVTDKDALETIPKLPHLYDEPFADSSQIPTALLSGLARAHVTVALSGDGGDELFGGYNRYTWAERFWGRIEPVPRPVRRLAGAALDAVPPTWWDRGFERAGPVLPRSLRVRMPGTKIHKIASVLPAADLNETYRLLASHFDDPTGVVLGASEPKTMLTSPERWPDVSGTELMVYLDTMTYMPDDILTKVDRASMGVSLEDRVPFLDPAVAALAWRMPFELKLRNGTGKWILRQVLYRYVPSEIVDRPKMGFGIPLASWLRRPLRDWAEDLISPERLGREGFLDPVPIRRIWADHLSGRSDREYELWDILMFQAWLQSRGVTN